MGKRLIKQKIVKEFSGAEQLLAKLYGQIKLLVGHEKEIAQSLVTSYLRFHKWTPDQCKLAKSLARSKQ